jgi:AcrR family transcriptional regulator
MSRIKERRRDLVASMMKDEIYHAAVDVLMKQGVDGLTMDRVAEAAGIAKGSLYNYFDNKSELVRFIHDKTIEPAKRQVREIVNGPQTAPEKMEAILRNWFELFVANRGIFDFLFNDARTREVLEEHKRNSRAEAINDLRPIFEQGIQEGSFRSLDPVRTAEMFLGAVIMICEQQVYGGEERPAGESVAALMDLFLQGLEPRVG